MKIGIVSECYYPHFGGISEVTYYLAEGLRAKGHDVFLIVPNFKEKALLEEKRVYRVGQAKVIQVLDDSLVVTAGKKVSLEIREILQKEKPDILHIQGTTMLGLAALKESEAKNIVTFHATFKPGVRTWLKANALKFFGRNILNKLHGRVAVSESAKKSVERYFKSEGEVRIIPNGIDLKRFSPEVLPFKEYTDGNLNILFVGRFDLRKGLHYLLKAFPLVKKKIPHCRLIIVGEGKLRYYYQVYTWLKRILERVLFVGRAPVDDLPRYYASCDVACFPSTGDESFGIVLLEAMSMGKPLVTFDIEGYRNVLENDVSGLMVKNKDHKALAAVLNRILTDNSLRKAYGENGLKKAGDFSWDRIIGLWEAYYHELVQKF